MKLNKIILFASASLLMTSCGIYNKYERPEVATKGLVRDVVSDTDTLPITVFLLASPKTLTNYLLTQKQKDWIRRNYAR